MCPNSGQKVDPSRTSNQNFLHEILDYLSEKVASVRNKLKDNVNGDCPNDNFIF